MTPARHEPAARPAARQPSGRGGAKPGRRQLLLAGMTLANAMILVDQTAVPLALPAIIRQFGVSSDQVQWVLNASLLPLAALLVAGGRLGDLLGRRRVFLAGSVLFAGASALAGLAPAFAVLLACRALQGAGGALMLPNTVAIISTAFPGHQRGRALGAMGGAAAIAAALGPAIGGALTSALSWRAVFLINVPLAAATVVVTKRAAPRDRPRQHAAAIDLRGAAALGVMLACLVFGLAQTPAWGWTSPAVLAALTASLAAAAGFTLAELSSPDPLMSLALLRQHPNYLAATLSQAIAGMAEMGLALLFPLLLILNLMMTPALAGLALIPVTVPMIIVAPLAGRWYDRAGGRWPLVAGFAVLALAGLLLARGVYGNDYDQILPGLLAFGTGLALVLTVNDPVSLDTVPAADHGQASGVSATAEQFGGAIGIAAFYLIFHATYVHRLQALIARNPPPHAAPRQLLRLRDALQAAEQTGLRPRNFPPDLVKYLTPARMASEHGYAAAFLATSALAAAALIAMAILVRPPRTDPTAGQPRSRQRRAVTEPEPSPPPRQHGLAAAFAGRRQQAAGLCERAKHTGPVKWWAQLQSLGLVRSSFQFAGMFVLSFLPFLLVVSAMFRWDLPQALVTRTGFSRQAATDVTSLFARSGAGAVSQSVIGILFVLAGGTGVASTLQDWYGKVFAESIPAWRRVGRQFWWLGGVVGFVAVQVMTGRHLRPLAGPALTAVVQFVLAVLFWWWTLHCLLASRLPWRRLLAGGVATAVLCAAVGVYFAVVTAGSIVASEHAYGAIGTIMALLETLVLLGLAVHLGAVIGARSGATSPAAVGRNRHS